MECNRCSWIRWGKHANGRQRWRCRTCKKTKVRQKDSMKHGLLKRYLLDGDTLGQLAERYHVHPLTIRNWLHSIFNKIPPPQANLDPTMSCWLITDATHFKHWGCLLVTKATTTKHPLAISFHCRDR